MNILTIPLRNMRRRLGRTLLLGALFAAGVLSAVALGYVARAVGESFERKLVRFGANILVYPRTETLALSYGGIRLGDLSYDVKYLREDEVTSTIRSIDLKERISAVAPKLLAVSAVAGRPVGLIGVDFPEETLIKSYWTVRGGLPKGPSELLAGSAAAASLGLAPGAALALDAGTFTVAGVLDPTGAEDDNFLFLDLHALQAAVGRPGLVNFVEVAALCSGCPIEEMVAHISHALPGAEVKGLSQVVRQRMYSVDFVDTLAWTVSLIILLTACATIALSLYASVGERKKEIGLLRSLGYGRSAIFSVFCFEALLTGLGAALVGYLGGYLASFRILGLLGVADVGNLGDVAAVAFDPVHLALTLGAVLLLTLAASAFPAWKAARIEPSEAFSLL